MALRHLTEESKECMLCNRKTIDEFKYGPMIRKRSIVLHYYCMLFAGTLEQRGKDDEGVYGFLDKDILEGVRAVESSVCSYCSGAGASIKCSKPKCAVVFHYPCGVENGSLHQFMGRFKSFCFAHRPRQRVAESVKVKAREEPPTCLVCLEAVDCDNATEVIWATCCRFTWYHRDCLQRLALNFGSLFKCAICRDKTKFREVVKRMGIYIPRRDGSWEAAPDAYQELYTRYQQCGADTCQCPSGRRHEDEEDWKLVLCTCCGSEGIHVRCGNLEEESWECDVCRHIR